MAAKHKGGRQRRSQDEIDVLVLAAVARLHEMAVAGVAPLMSEYDAAHGDAPSTAMLARYRVRYRDIVRLAELQPQTAAAQRRVREASEIPEEVEAEIRAAFAAQAETARFSAARPMQAIPTRIEVLEYPLPNGGVYRVTRCYASIR